MRTPLFRLCLLTALLCGHSLFSEAASKADGWRTLPLISHGHLDKNWVHIGLQTHDPKDIVWFKEISVRPLPKSDTK